MIIILEEFFIRFSDSSINLFIKLIDFIISVLDKFGNKGNLENEESSNEKNFENKEIFKINNFLKNDSIFEELENRYSNDDYQNFDESGENRMVITDKFMDILLKNKFISIDESNIHNSFLRIIIIIFSILILVVALISYFLSIELGMVFFITFFLIAFAIFYYPKIKKQNDYSSFSKELPFALRQLATELRSGKSLFDSMDSISRSDYGILSLEFSRVLEEIKYGESTEQAFLNLEKRVDSKAFSRVIYEILTSLRVGANLSTSLTIIADDVNFDIRMKLKEYSEKLNAFIMIYTFLAILAPVILLTILLAASVVMGDLVPADLILVLYSVFFPMIIIFLGFAIKKLEPKI